MQSAVWLENQRVEIRQIEIPEPTETEAVVQVLLSCQFLFLGFFLSFATAFFGFPCPAICTTDLEMISGYYPFTGVLGHEFVGRVVALPTCCTSSSSSSSCFVSALDRASWRELIHRRVVAAINIGCRVLKSVWSSS